MPLTLEQYATYLDTRQLPWPAPPEVNPPKAKPHLVPLPDIRAVMWNVYGTLLAIPGGELYFTHPHEFVMNVALEKTIQEFNMWGSMTRKPGQPAEYMSQMYKNVLAELSTSSGQGHKHPEVACDRIWEAIIKKLLQKDYQFDTSFYGSLNEFSAKVAYFFHASLQATAAVAAAARALKHIADKGIVQGLLADGQCFTALQLQRGLAAQDSLARLEDLMDIRLWALSYDVGEHKPSQRLFQQALTGLKERGITADQVLHVGSRIKKDIAPARRLGMRTALFAGDSSSLQATNEQLHAPSTRPDILLTELEQIIEVL